MMLCDAPTPTAREPYEIPFGVVRDGVASAVTLAAAGSPLATFTFYDPSVRPSTSAAAPLAVDVRGGSQIVVEGTGFRPGGAARAPRECPVRARPAVSPRP